MRPECGDQPRLIDNEPGVSTAEECAGQQLIHHTLQTPDTSAAVLQSATADNPEWGLTSADAPYSTDITRCSILTLPWSLQRPGIIIQQTIGHHRGDVRRLFISFPWPNSGDICHWPVSGGRSLSSLSLLHHHSHHCTEAPILIINTRITLILYRGPHHLPFSFWGWLTPASNYKIGSQDDIMSSTNQNLDHSFKGKMVLKKGFYSWS